MEGRLPLKITFDYKIKLKEGAKLKFHKVYYLIPTQNVILKAYLKEHLEKGLIRLLKSEYALPILFIFKKDGIFKLVMDSR